MFRPGHASYQEDTSSNNTKTVLCFVSGATRRIRLMKTKLVQYFPSVYFVNQPRG